MSRLIIKSNSMLRSSCSTLVLVGTEFRLTLKCSMIGFEIIVNGIGMCFAVFYSRNISGGVLLTFGLEWSIAVGCTRGRFLSVEARLFLLDLLAMDDSYKRWTLFACVHWFVECVCLLTKKDNYIIQKIKIPLIPISVWLLDI